MYIAIIDYRMGNIKSVENSFKNSGAAVKVTSDPEVIRSADAVVLPGVGAYRDAYNNIEKMGLVEPIYENIRKKPFLGICLGMQLLFEYSLEDGKNNGLGIFKGFVDRIPPGVKIPHIGWNQLEIKKESKLLKDIKSGENFYFVHSYHIVPEDRSLISSTTDYGTDLVASIEEDNIFGFQFHPEKSSTIGQQLIKNFISLAEEKRCL
ncbi:MAG: imidazole glycerol phosphate synthase subunit HisH [Actinomycetota bacterium]|nr:MAG: imidazole glycerol phosphate synthase subunit HisH [Actinomycetota bacterium]